MRLPVLVPVVVAFTAALAVRAEGVHAFPPGVADGLLGHAIVIAVPSKPPEEIGHLVDVLVDADGHPVAAVLDVGGFLGVGNRKVAVTWDALGFAPGKDGLEITVNLDADRLKAAPDYKGPAKSVQALSP